MFHRLRFINKAKFCPSVRSLWCNTNELWTRAALIAGILRACAPVTTKLRLTLTLPVVYALGSVTKKNTTSSVMEQISASDELFASSKFKESYDVLVPFKDSDNAEVLWRLSQSLYNMAEEENLSGNARLAVILEADGYIQRAYALDDENSAIEKWLVIIMDAKASLEGVKARVSSLPEVKKHILRAIELNPKDATSLHIMGAYFYNLADLPWYQRQIASALFGKVPDASFEEALTYFSKAEEVAPNFYSKNLLYMAKTYQKLGMKELARDWLQRAADCDGKTQVDRNVKKEAADLLKKM